MLVTLFVHRIAEGRSGYPGWRWCVQVGDDPADESRWLNAGWCPSADTATAEGDMVAATVVKLARMFLAGADYSGPVLLDYDPCRSSAIGVL